MKRISLFIISLITISASAQTTIKQDAGIKQMVDEVSAKNIEAIVRKLVSFKTRHTLKRYR
jgi:molybdopterin biosynthesis enzyme MoaB